MLSNTRVLLAAMLKDRKGISSLEYAVLAAGILGVLATAVGTVGTQITTIFATIVSELGGS
jgi:Flp pilus assembly pilin Flp